MFAQDPYSGYVHEAPELAGYGYGGYAEPEYAGYGSYAQPEYAGYAEPEYGDYAEPEYAGYGYYGEPAYDGFGYPVGEGILSLINAQTPMGRLMRQIANRGHPSQFPWPLGWRRPELPYTGLGPRRMYMRCAMWPGPAGLVPTHAAALSPQQQAMAAQAQAQAQARAGGRGRRRRRR
jgi:hypothetical protein